MDAGKETGASCSAPISKLTGLRAYHANRLVQSGIWKRWEAEARRLFIEFWRTADDRHLHAFAEHVRGMRSFGRPWKMERRSS
jgi:hypothetical protein